MEPGGDTDTVLTRGAEPVLREIADLFATKPVSVILCDSRGAVSRRTAIPVSNTTSTRVCWLAPGFSYAEHMVGTNGASVQHWRRAAVLRSSATSTTRTHSEPWPGARPIGER